MYYFNIIGQCFGWRYYPPTDTSAEFVQKWSQEANYTFVYTDTDVYGNTLTEVKYPGYNYLAYSPTAPNQHNAYLTVQLEDKVYVTAPYSVSRMVILLNGFWLIIVPVQWGPIQYVTLNMAAYDKSTDPPTLLSVVSNDWDLTFVTALLKEVSTSFEVSAACADER